MKITEFKRKDGTVGQNYIPEAGDKFVANFAKVGSRENLAIVNKKPVKIMNYFLEVLEGNEKIVLNITSGQKKVLDKTDNLTGKTIVFEEYTHKTYGKQVGARVLK